MKQLMNKLARILITLSPTLAFGTVGSALLFLGEPKIPDSMLKQ
jgi:hypothetical protein